MCVTLPPKGDTVDLSKCRSGVCLCVCVTWPPSPLALTHTNTHSCFTQCDYRLCRETTAIITSELRGLNHVMSSLPVWSSQMPRCVCVCVCVLQHSLYSYISCGRKPQNSKTTLIKGQTDTLLTNSGASLCVHVVEQESPRPPQH